MVSAAIANKGIVMNPRMVDRVVAPDLTVQQTFENTPFGRALSEKDAATMTGLMIANVSDGAASGARIGGVDVAGKTGTAQVKRITERERDMGITQDQLPWHLRHHALFVCFGPVDNPRYACAVIVEHGQAGGVTAGPIGRDVLVETMKRDPSRRSDRYGKMASR